MAQLWLALAKLAQSWPTPLPQIGRRLPTFGRTQPKSGRPNPQSCEPSLKSGRSHPNLVNVVQLWPDVAQLRRTLVKPGQNFINTASMWSNPARHSSERYVVRSAAHLLGMQADLCPIRAAWAKCPKFGTRSTTLGQFGPTRPNPGPNSTNSGPVSTKAAPDQPNWPGKARSGPNSTNSGSSIWSELGPEATEIGSNSGSWPEFGQQCLGIGQIGQVRPASYQNSPEHGPNPTTLARHRPRLARTRPIFARHRPTLSRFGPNLSFGRRRDRYLGTLIVSNL